MQFIVVTAVNSNYNPVYPIKPKLFTFTEIVTKSSPSLAMLSLCFFIISFAATQGKGILDSSSLVKETLLHRDGVLR